jgi:hypothetical protein
MEDGSLGWDNIDIANDQLNNRDPGWVWVAGSTWQIDFSAPNCDPRDGWSYAFDFGGRNRIQTNYSGKKSAIHYVRRRRLLRPQVFRQEEFQEELIRREAEEAERKRRVEESSFQGVMKQIDQGFKKGTLSSHTN